MDFRQLSGIISVLRGFFESSLHIIVVEECFIFRCDSGKVRSGRFLKSFSQSRSFCGIYSFEEVILRKILAQNDHRLPQGGSSAAGGGRSRPSSRFAEVSLNVRRSTLHRRCRRCSEGSHQILQTDVPRKKLPAIHRHPSRHPSFPAFPERNL